MHHMEAVFNWYNVSYRTLYAGESENNDANIFNCMQLLIAESGAARFVDNHVRKVSNSSTKGKLDVTPESHREMYSRLLSALLTVDDTEVIRFLLSTEIIPLCLRTMEMGNELPETVSFSEDLFL